MDIYVVTQGKYSSYHIVAMFDSEELAKQFIAETPKFEDYSEYMRSSIDIETWTINEYVESLQNGRWWFFVNVSDVARSSALVDEIHNHNPRMFRRNENYLQTHVQARDEQHAIKIAYEQLMKLKATGEWETMPDVSCGSKTGRLR